MEFGKARVEKQGDHCTIVTFSRMTDLALALAAEMEKSGVSVEVINLLSLRPLVYWIWHLLSRALRKQITL